MSPRRVVVAISVLLVACQPLQDRNPTITEPVSGTSPAGDSAVATFVFDGDSFEADVGGETEEVRLLGINAPEGDECYGDQARDALEDHVDGRRLTLVRGSGDDRDEFGRLLRYVYAGDRDINGAMLFHGQAVVLQSDHDRNGEFVAIGTDAAEREAGLWAGNACGPRARRDVSVAWVEYNPPGPDDDALEDEYVEIVNEGSLRIDLAGWTLRDESSRNRYVFDRALRSGDRVLVRSGCGTDRGENVYWCSDRSIWSNGGDTAILQDENGSVVSWRTYSGG